MTVTAVGNAAATAPTPRIARFPFPFRDDVFRHSTNVEPARRPVPTEAGAWGAAVIDIDDEYDVELELRQRILAADPTRCIVLPHMRVAAWDSMLLIMRELATSYPEHMSLRRNGNDWHWRNGLLDLAQDFTFGDEDSLPCAPLRFIGNQVQEDIVLLDQRADELWADAGLVTFASGWSLKFDVGMRFLEVHGPVPRIHEEGVITRAHQFLLRLQVGQDYRRTNWSMTVDRRLDMSTETYPEWARDRRLVAAGDASEVGRRLHLRVEVQHLLRLPASGGILFLIRTHMLSLNEIASVPAWRRRFGAVLAQLPQDIVDYKGMSRYRDAAVSWLTSA